MNNNTMHDIKITIPEDFTNKVTQALSQRDSDVICGIPIEVKYGWVDENAMRLTLFDEYNTDDIWSVDTIVEHITKILTSGTFFTQMLRFIMYNNLDNRFLSVLVKLYLSQILSQYINVNITFDKDDNIYLAILGKLGLVNQDNFSYISDWGYNFVNSFISNEDMVTCVEYLIEQKQLPESIKQTEEIMRYFTKDNT